MERKSEQFPEYVKVIKGKERICRVGEVWRAKGSGPFNDATILGIRAEITTKSMAWPPQLKTILSDPERVVWVRLGRPYLYADSHLIPRASPLMGFEDFETTLEKFYDGYNPVTEGNGFQV